MRTRVYQELNPEELGVVEEMGVLNDKINKMEQHALTKEYRDTVSIDEQIRRTQQIKFMRYYSDILGQRIANFPKVWNR